MRVFAASDWMRGASGRGGRDGEESRRAGGMGGVDRERGTERASVERMQAGVSRRPGGSRGRHPRGAQAPCEGGKAGESCSLRPGRLARSSVRERKRERERENQWDEARREAHRGQDGATEGHEIAERRGCRSVRARRSGIQGVVRERSPWKSRGERFAITVRPTDRPTPSQ